ncbi:21904_t:CDS:2, partial [Gigaspora rosea]
KHPLTITVWSSSSQEGAPEWSLLPLPPLTNDNISLITHSSASSEYNNAPSLNTPAPTSSNTLAPTKPLIANASYIQFFFEDDEADNTIRAKRVSTPSYPYNKSGGSTENLIQHFRDKYKIIFKNYLYYLDSQNQNTRITSSNAKKENEKLDQLCLTSEEKKLLEEMVEVLKPFEEITKHVCGAKYPTMNLVYPYIRILKNKYAPIAEKGESIESWLDLIYGASIEDSKQISDSDTSISSDDKANILSAWNRKQWQYAYVHQRRMKQCRRPNSSKLFALKPNHYESDNEKTQDTIEEDCDSLSAKL